MSKNLELYLDYVKESASDYLTPLHYPATQSILPSSFKPQLYHIPIKSTHTQLFK